MAEKIIRTAELCRRLGISRQTAWKWARSGYLPPSREVGPHVRGWVESEIDDWIRRRAVAIGADDGNGRRK